MPTALLPRITPVRIALLVACVSLILPAGAAAQADGPGQLRTRLTGIVYSALAEVEADVAPDAAGMIRHMIDVGVDRVAADGMTPEAVTRAQDGTHVFVRGLIAEGRQPDGGVRVNESIVGATRFKLCPLYPFC